MRKGKTRTNLFEIYRTWIIMAIVYSASIMLGKLVFFALLVVIASRGVSEFFLAARIGKSYFVLTLIAAVASMVTALSSERLFFYTPIIFFLAAVALSIFAFDAKKQLGNAALALFAFMWLPFQLGFLLILTKNSQWQAILLATATAIALNDVFSYVTGKLMSSIGINQGKIAGKISTNKTWLGAAGGFLGALLGLLIMALLLLDLSLAKIFAIAASIAVFCNIGGFVNSFVKRNLGIKDFPKLLPGHGGIIDRIDSLATTAVCLYFLQLAGIL
ncbi:phosphatidate cytidylyltransferase [Candidatus Woesearchaeota archaeon]|nr:phosphatidate cytidylyltransferase [Candidatus Woesearchaeota archaeon]